MRRTNRHSDRHRPGQTYRAITSSSDTSCTKHGIPPQQALIFDEKDVLICKSVPRDSALSGLIYGYVKGTRHMGYAGEGLFHQDQVRIIEDSESSSDGTGAGAADNRGDSRSTPIASEARQRANGGSATPSPGRGGGGQLYVAKSSSAESWSKYKIRFNRLLFLEGDYLVSERVSRTTGEHFGYVVDTKYPAKEKRPCPDKSKGYFHLEQVQIVNDSPPSSNHDSNLRSNPNGKNKSLHPLAEAAAAATGGGICAPDKDALLSRELSSKRRKTGVESVNSDKRPNCGANVEAKLSQRLLAKRETGNENGRATSTKTCTSQDLSASKRQSDPGTSSGPSHEEDTETKLSRGLSAKRIKRSDSAASSTSESNNSGIDSKMLGSRSQPPQRVKTPSNAAKRKAETMKPDQTRPSVARKDSSGSISSSNNSPNAKLKAESDMDEAKGKRMTSSAKEDEGRGRSRVDKSSNEGAGMPRTSNGKKSACDEDISAAMPIEIHQYLHETVTAASAAVALEGNNALDADGLVALQSKPNASKEPSSSGYMQVPTAMAMKSRFPPGCVVIHTSDDGSTKAFTICSVHLKLTSDELVSGRSNFDVLFKVGTGEDDKILSEESLVFARDCPIFVQADAVPHFKRDSGWVPATVKSSMKLPGAIEEDYVVTIANGGTAHVPRDTIRYRNPTLSKDTGVPASNEHTKPISAATSVADPAPPVAVVVAPVPTSTTETVSAESVTEDGSKGSSSHERAPKKVANASDPSAIIVCRIDVPDRVAFGTIQKLLSPKMEPMKRRLKVEMFVVGSNNPPPKDAGIVRSFGDIFPRPLSSGVYSTSILIRGQAENTEKSRKAVIFFLKEGVNDDESLDKDLEAGCSKARAIKDKVSESVTEGTDAAASANASSVSKPREKVSENSKLAANLLLERFDSSKSVASNTQAAISEQVMIRFEVKLSSRTKHVKSLFAKGTNHLVCTVEKDTNCKISMREGTRYYIKVSGIEENSVTLAAMELYDVLRESDIPEDCIKQTSGPKLPDTPTNKFLLPAKKSERAIPTKGAASVQPKESTSAAPTKSSPPNSKRESKSIPTSKSNTSPHHASGGSNKKAPTSTQQYVLPKWLKYADMDTFFESSKKKETESKILCSIRLVNRIAPIRLELSNNDPTKGDFWGEWCTLTESIAECCLSKNEMPIFFYECTRRNSGKIFLEKHPVLQCHTASKTARKRNLVVYSVAIPLRNEQHATHVIGVGGINTRRILKLGCKFKVYNVSLAGKYAFIESSSSKDTVKTARQIVEDLIEEMSPDEKSETTTPSKIRTDAEFRMPVWISYDDVSDFFEGSQVKTFERQSGVCIEISDRRSPMNIALSSSTSQDLWDKWETFAGAISKTIDEDMKPRFLYDIIFYNYSGKKEQKISPVLTCQSPFDSEERLLMAVLPIPTRPKGSYAGYIVGTGGIQRRRIEKIGCTFDVYEFPSRQDLSYVLVTGAVRSNVKTARDIVQERIDECRGLRKIEMENVEDDEDEDEAPQVIYQPPSHDLEDEEEDDEPEVVFRPQRPQEGKRTIQILNMGIFIRNDWAQVKRWQNKFRNRGVKLSVRVRESKAELSGPEHELDSLVREINSWQRSQRPSTPPRRQPRRTSDVVFGGVVM